MSGPCPYCGSAVELVMGHAIYGERWASLATRSFWACVRFPHCDAYVGCHPGTNTPLGRLADKHLRRWKSAAHAAFDPLWQAKLSRRLRERGPAYKKAFARGSGYKWLAEQLGIPREQCHIGLFDIDTCKRVVTLCEPYRSALRDRAA